MFYFIFTKEFDHCWFVGTVKHEFIEKPNIISLIQDYLTNLLVSKMHSESKCDSRHHDNFLTIQHARLWTFDPLQCLKEPRFEMPNGGLAISIGDAKRRHSWRDGQGTSTAILEGSESIKAIKKSGK
jgi:hypothetical protein